MTRTFDTDVLIGDKLYWVTGKYAESQHDDSFRHEFGVHHCGHSEVDDVSIENVFLIDNEGTDLPVPFEAALWAKLEEELLQTLA